MHTLTYIQSFFSMQAKKTLAIFSTPCMQNNLNQEEAASAKAQQHIKWMCVCASFISIGAMKKIMKLKLMLGAGLSDRMSESDYVAIKWTQQ